MNRRLARLPWCPGWELNAQEGLTPRNLLILRNTKTEKNHKNTQVRYTAGTRFYGSLVDGSQLFQLARFFRSLEKMSV
jgi:peptide methionine sulfoxide reductase MsrB